LQLAYDVFISLSSDKLETEMPAAHAQTQKLKLETIKLDKLNRSFYGLKNLSANQKRAFRGVAYSPFRAVYKAGRRRQSSIRSHQ